MFAINLIFILMNINNFFHTVEMYFDKIIVILLCFVWYEITFFSIKCIFYIKQNNDILLQIQLRDTLLQVGFVKYWQKKIKVYSNQNTCTKNIKKVITHYSPNHNNAILNVPSKNSKVNIVSLIFGLLWKSV